MVYPRTSNRQRVSRSMELTKVTRKQLVNLSIIVPPHSHIYINLEYKKGKKKEKHFPSIENHVRVHTDGETKPPL